MARSPRWLPRARPGTTARPGTAATALLLGLVLTASASGFAWYRIRPGDTLSAIAARYHTTVARLVALNHLPGSGNLIYAGAQLRVPVATPDRRPSDRPGWRTVRSVYLVQPGDTLDGISARFHASWQTIAATNHLGPSLMVFIGQRLVVPHRVYLRPASGAHLFSGGWVPDRWAMEAIIRATALRWGVDPRLALAISWQESGFNQRMVSPVGALGAMQVMPYTGSFVADYVVHRPLDLYSGSDNATAGVALLDVLLRETGGNAARAVAGYYQGLASVEARGMFPDTKQYVADVLALRDRF